MIHNYRKSRVRLADGASLTPLASDTGVVNGASHARGGVDLGNVEVEGQEVMKQNPDGSTNVYSDKLGYADAIKPLANRKGQLEQILARLSEQEQLLSDNSGLDIPQRNTISTKILALNIQKKPVIEEIQNIDAQMQQLFQMQQQENGGQQVAPDGQATAEPQMAFGGKLKIPQLNATPAVSESSAVATPVTPRIRQQVSLTNSSPMVNSANVRTTAPINYTPMPKARPVSNIHPTEEHGIVNTAVHKFIEPVLENTGKLVTKSAPYIGNVAHGIEKGLSGLASGIPMIEGLIGITTGKEADPITRTLQNKDYDKNMPMMKRGGKIKAWDGIKLKGFNNNSPQLEPIKPLMLDQFAVKNAMKPGLDIGTSPILEGASSTPKKKLSISLNKEGIGNMVDSAMPFIDNIGNAILNSATPQISTPTMTKVPRINTKVDISSDVNTVNNSIDSANKMISNYSSNPTANIAANSVRRINALNPIYQNRNNQERELQNRQLELIGANDASNSAKIDAYGIEKAKRDAGVLNDTSANLADMSKDILSNREFKANQDYQNKWLDVEADKYGNNIFDKYLADFDNEDDFIKKLKENTPSMTQEGERLNRARFRNKKTNKKSAISITRK